MDFTSLIPAINAARTIKDEYEIDAIRRANDISSAAHTHVLRNITAFQNETEIQAAFLQACISRGAQEQAYSVIAASGRNASVLHYARNNDDLKGKQMVCLDAGCEWECYASDVTRTFPLTPAWPSKEAKAIYDIVEQMQEEVIRRLKPGVRYRDMNILATKLAIAGLSKLGIFRKHLSYEDIFVSGRISLFFPHGLGHHVGLEVHDVSAENIMGLSNPPTPTTTAASTQFPPSPPLQNPFVTTAISSPTLQPGMIVTVEPGIYFSAAALRSDSHIADYVDLDVVQRYMDVGGVRIEDDILITREGNENLTKAPKGEEMLEHIRKGAAMREASGRW